MDIKISVQPGKGFKKHVGGKTFYLGHDEHKATVLATSIVETWQTEKATALKAGKEPKWSETALNSIEFLRRLMMKYPNLETAVMDICDTHRATVAAVDAHLINIGLLLPANAIPAAIPAAISPAGLTAIPAGNAIAAVPNAPAGPMSLYQALDAFIVKQRNGSINEFSKLSLESRIRRIKDAILDMPMALFGADAIETILTRWIKAAQAGEWSKATVQGYTGALRHFVDWADRSEAVAWEAPRRFEKLFDIRAKLARISGRKKSPDMTIEDIAKLYKAGDNREKLLVLLGLNCGFTQIDVATLTIDMVNIADNGQAYIDRDRHKTGVACGWVLWKETWDLLLPEMSVTGATGKDIILKSATGRPLVSVDNGARSDLFAAAWDKLRERAGFIEKGTRTVKPGCERFAFKYLRKIASQRIRNHAGQEVSEAFLGHSDGGIRNADGGTAYNEFQAWDKLTAALAELRKDLAPLFS